ncbi:MAG: ribosomal protein S18-alanine N-acetyltransferase [Clostridiales bacterium]|jgi:ribosomal-protein-alanine N-acetyltransferase|nr:ribosomal protein S18-alanine N-acetyltransferase [Clostridiales bacterium]
MNESEPVIRSADLSDIKRIMALEEGSIIHPWTSGDIETLITDCNKECLVADLAGEVVGYVGAETVLDECNIGNIVVDKDRRGRGIATILMDNLLNDLKNRGIKKIFLEVESNNAPAMALYGKTGFVRYGQRRDYYGQGKDAVLMSKDLC